MANPKLLAPSCQSCGAEIKNRFEFGTTATGVIDVNYCKFCFWKGEFTEPDITMEQMIEKVAASMAEKKRMPIERAKILASELIPTLKRWRKEEEKAG